MSDKEINPFDVTSEMSIQERLDILNARLMQKAEQVGFPMGQIIITGVVGGVEAMVDAIKAQYDGLMQRAADFQNRLHK